MKHRIISLVAILVLAFGAGISLFPGQASAATEYFYNNAQFNAIQGPNPYANSGDPTNVTYQKVNDPNQWYGFGNGTYLALGPGASVPGNNGGSCIPAIQTNSKKYDGDKKATLYLECGTRSAPEGYKGEGKSITVGSSSNNTYQQQQAGAQCQGKTGQAMQACTAGATGATNGKTKQESCQGLSGANLTTCEDAWNAVNSQDPGANEPTCESSGSVFGWVLCPIFNGLADSSQWIFQNIVQPFLITPPISTDPQDPAFQIWSNLRIYGNIFLLLALLVIVFGESIGGGMIDAYTAKKVLPRLLVAAVLINLSIYLVAFLVDFTNILGKGVGVILTEPLTHCTSNQGTCWSFDLSNPDAARVFGVGLIGLLAGGTAAVGFLGTIIFGGFAGIAAVMTMAFFVLLPMFFAILAVFITLILRKGLILMLVLVSPVAFALYCLPNTERYFKKWWELLLQALMVYPIIIAIFGVAAIMSVTILSANGISPSDLQTGGISGAAADNINRTLALVVAFLLQFLPLLAIPFAFRMAGGVMGRIYEAATGAGQKVNQLAENRREHAKRDYQAQALAKRASAYHKAGAFGTRHQGPFGIGRRAANFAARRAGGYNIEGLMSASRAEYAKQVNDQIATGRDEEIRGLSVNKRWAMQQGALNEANGFNNGQVRRGDNGQMQFKSLGGAWIDEQDVDAGHSRWGNNQFAQQAALSYEMRKAVSEDQIGNLTSNYQHVAMGPGGWGMSDGEAGGAFKGAAFENQNQHVELKHTNVQGQLSAAHDFVDEIYHNKGSYNLSQMNSATIKRLQDAHVDAQSRGDVDQMEKIKAISETFMNSSRMRPGDGDDAPPRPEEGAGAVGGRMFNSQGSASTAERARQLAVMTGAYTNPPTGNYTERPERPREQE